MPRRAVNGFSRRLCGTSEDSEIANLWFAMSGANVDRSDRSKRAFAHRAEIEAFAMNAGSKRPFS
jgi:hypothetical protein